MATRQRSDLEKAIIKYLRSLRGVNVSDKTTSELVAREIMKLIKKDG